MFRPNMIIIRLAPRKKNKTCLQNNNTRHVAAAVCTLLLTSHFYLHYTTRYQVKSLVNMQWVLMHENERNPIFTL